MNERQEIMMAYFDKKIKSCGSREKSLLADNRADEADFEKIRANVYDIFRTMFLTAIKTSGENDAAAVERFFLLKMEQIPGKWEESYEMAKQHEDAKKIQIEHIKLETMKDIKTAFKRIWEEEK